MAAQGERKRRRDEPLFVRSSPSCKTPKTKPTSSASGPSSVAVEGLGKQPDHEGRDEERLTVSVHLPPVKARPGMVKRHHPIHVLAKVASRESFVEDLLDTSGTSSKFLLQKKERRVSLGKGEKERIVENAQHPSFSPSTARRSPEGSSSPAPTHPGGWSRDQGSCSTSRLSVN